MLQKILSVKELELLSTEEKEKYYQMVREYCNLIKVNIESKKISKKIIDIFHPCRYDLFSANHTGRTGKILYGGGAYRIRKLKRLLWNV